MRAAHVRPAANETAYRGGSDPRIPESFSFIAMALEECLRSDDEVRTAATADLNFRGMGDPAAVPQSTRA